MRKSPLLVLAQVLTKRLGLPLPDFPRENEAAAVRQYMETLLPLIPGEERSRAREVYEYLEKASRGGGHPGTGRGSLKNILWTMRDLADPDEYTMLAARLLTRVLNEPALPLDEELAGRLLDDPGLAHWAMIALNRPPTLAHAHYLTLTMIHGRVIAYTTAPLNLLKVAARLGADLYVASSPRGAVVKALKQKGKPPIPSAVLDNIVKTAGGNWAAPYSDLRVCREEPPSIEELLAAIMTALD